MKTGTELNMRRRLPQYLLGLIIMALGIVLIKKSALGMSPISALPAAVTELTALSLGTTTAAWHIVCMLLQLAVTRRVTLRLALLLPLAVVFGWLIDLFMSALAFTPASLPLRWALCLVGIVFTALGIVFINGADLMLPAPDALLRAVSLRTGAAFSRVKIAGDVLWVALTAALELGCGGAIVSVGAGTLACMVLTGLFSGQIKKLLPQLEMPPVERN